VAGCGDGRARCPGSARPPRACTGADRPEATESGRATVGHTLRHPSDSGAPCPQRSGSSARPGTARGPSCGARSPATSKSRRLTRESEGPGSATGWTPAGDIDPSTGLRAAAHKPRDEGADWQLVGKPTWVAPEGPELSFFLKCTAVSTQPSARCRLPAQLVASAPGPAPARERHAGRAFGSEVPGARDRRHSTRGAGGRGNPGHFWHLPAIGLVGPLASPVVR